MIAVLRQLQELDVTAVLVENKVRVEHTQPPRDLTSQSCKMTLLG